MIRPLLLALALVVAVSAPALAHKIKVFATAEGAVVSGLVYFPGGGKAVGAPVQVLGPDGVEIGRVTTDDAGAFTFEATRRIDHTFVADTGDGHRGTFVVKADQLPVSLPGGEDAAGAPSTAAPAAAPAAAAPVLDPAALEDAVARAVAREVNPLRLQIEAYEERIRLHDILGGLGWIAGITGLAFWLLGRKKQG
ncbi:hypothetical protein [Caenispirillum bisanense]|uniref:Nickel transport protein n=1 Tax=Caenispirillum bisanense TaxID=414052 RepID=A0A286GLS0_9PROT|nr:hypothetical protein [Caenispirillum bisanense]SOD96460.1 nickel transport protein [Caenispirillum bisanense]